MKVLVADKIADEGIRKLRDAGYDVDVKTGQSEEELIANIPDYEALIVRSATNAPRSVIEAGTKLKIIGRAGVGVDNVDVVAATERGVIVCNAPTSNVISAAEQALALMLCAARRTAQANASMHAGKWDRSKFTGNELYGKTLAIFGLGRIGGLVAERAKAFGMDLIGYDPYCSPERAATMGVKIYDNVNEICTLADFITVHLPKTKETLGMFGPEQYALMKDGVYLINDARGGIYNIESLADFVAAGKIGGVGLDVYESEPCTQSPLHEFDNVILTPHLGASTVEAQNRAGEQIADFVMLGLQGKMVPTAVNVAPVPPEVLDAVGPFIPACEVLGSIIAQMADEGISSLDVKAYGELASHDVTVLATSALRGLFAESSDEPVNFVNAAYIAEQRGIAVNVSKTPECLDYASMVDIIAHIGSREIEVACTISGNQQQIRIVSINGYKLDTVPGANFAVLIYEDRPGRLGTIGTITGNAGINIETLELSDAKQNAKPDNKALVALNVSSPVPDGVKDEIAEAVDLAEGYYINL